MTCCSLIVKLLFYALFILFGLLLIKIPTIAWREYDTMMADCWQHTNQSSTNEQSIHIVEVGKAMPTRDARSSSI
ncbi:hypothetical protein DERP_001392 [Dermatophagoides pteronyssinus]|uniref:Uncharacterized protein n=1 Tax=Dermatophagoides pteronyssinus TaxID=6956 RepID=A0ABQ8JEB1_DERPT|nr:hypothetical protein DERP_001392 [Dermatophagoides pteronyssinus]